MVGEDVVGDTGTQPAAEHLGMDEDDHDLDDDMFNEDAVDHGMVVDTLMAYGAEPAEAVFAATRMIRPEKTIHDAHPARFWELYGSGNITRASIVHRRNLNVKGIRVLDLRYKKDSGDAWDFSRKSDRAMAMDLLEAEDPDFVIGAPPCTACCLLNVNINCSQDG